MCCAQCEEEVEEGPYSAHALLTQQREPGVRPLPPSSLYQSPLVAVSLVKPMSLVMPVSLVIPVTLLILVTLLISVSLVGPVSLVIPVTQCSDTIDISDTSATSCGI